MNRMNRIDVLMEIIEKLMDLLRETEERERAEEIYRMMFGESGISE